MVQVNESLTIVAGFPPTETQSNSTSLFSSVKIKSPCKMRGDSGGTNTVSVAKCDRIPS